LKKLSHERKERFCLLFWEKPHQNFLTATLISRQSDLGKRKKRHDIGRNGICNRFNKGCLSSLRKKSGSVIDFAQPFFWGGYMLKEFNRTNIALTPKIDSPSHVLLKTHFTKSLLLSQKKRRRKEKKKKSLQVPNVINIIIQHQ